MLDVADVPQVPTQVQALLFGCISLVGTPCADFYEALLTANTDRVILIDPNIRAGFVEFMGNEPAYRARLDRMIGKSDIVKLSDEDLHWLAGAGDLDALAEGLLAKGPKLVVVTRGGEGISGWTKAGRVDVTASKVTVADTVGAGDTVNAGILASLVRLGALSKSGVAGLSGDQLTDILSFSTRAAAITVSRPGANPPWAHEL
jgi:fructokinase